MSSREVSFTTQLRRAGVVDSARAQQLIEEIADVSGFRFVDPALSLSYYADPDTGLLQLLRVCEAAQQAGVVQTVHDVLRSPAGRRLGVVLGGSVALGDFLVRRPDLVSDFLEWEDDDPVDEVDVRARLLEAVGADPGSTAPVATVIGDEGIVAMRVAYRRELLRVAAIDLMQSDPITVMPAVGAVLADLAGAALEAGLAIARAAEKDHALTRLAILGMGKCGARELNYVSDVDVIYAAEPAEGADEQASLRVATRLAAAAARACDRFAAEPPLWQVDANLRPEGKDGALVRGLSSHLAYYERWAQSWEFQALLKARPIAGDPEIGERYVQMLQPLVWSAVERENFVEAAQAMRRRVEQYVPANEADRQIKLGPGGLRDVEFTIQLLQLVHGRADESLRERSTLTALAALRAGGYVGRPEAAAMDRAYRQLRVWEHRLQLRKLSRTHLMPEQAEDRRILARASGFATVEYMDEVWHDIRRRVRAMHLEMFYRPILPVVARLSTGEASLDTAAARDRLSAVGFKDADAALRHIVALTGGVSRSAAIRQQLLPAMIGWFAEGPEPDAGLLAFRQLSEQLGSTQWFLKLLRDSGTAAERLARLLSTSGYVTKALLATAEQVRWLDSDEDLKPRPYERLWREADSILTRSDNPEQAITAMRGLRRRELARVAAADTLGLVNASAAAGAVTDTADMLIEGALRVAIHTVREEVGEEPPRLLVVAMGRYGGREMGYSSDADVQFIFEGGGERAGAHAQRLATVLRNLLQKVGPQPSLEIDADLRPEGRNGPLARSFESTVGYYARWSDPWEAQALLRARPCAGDPDLRARFVEAVSPVRYPEVLKDEALAQMRRLKARMEAERLPRGVDPRRHLKLGPGGLSDVEWTVQLLQLQHAHRIPELRTTETIAALDVAADAGLLDAEDAATLREAWTLATDLRGAIALRGRQGDPDVLPVDARELKVLAEIMGTGDTGPELDDRFVRAARHARAVCERVFFGWEEE
ncbi:bifunctional [glutamine synthetase] adenylyltransferase/[glutamine synthetase]-adenylyl-L-tyrosine phosphorylase [Demequina zhanjiangensis]|uniref:Bifunctional [glutamine synthetase] adenylyltransferase/[glutamine synthetase]-adenylyl-L-tyrosine phosphorylase n=1 Tax=Demequina zhanjiangensis TaxID=3051659 RepID=A0ABT8G0L7_9MICO|nr:bifunctional [glutamine synthetase] adenylyltransferase/[glutamine synthetase]-adenylyl-L-tyrosine phosphorylase [Demequina sp. SYSU T00b26]MDN4472623.1 bifunctional [glutamine synthetase] adenylyltransferase/[glutamine synthetase]-adenylyl-L-tyrosine phosphorylase [Demequina sp. SYSU T00b26]